MAPPSRNDQKKKELEKARKAGLVPAEVDEHGNEINPHIPDYMATAPWYVNADNKPGLEHQRKPMSSANKGSNWRWYTRGVKIFKADNFRKGACENCGAMTHNVKGCTERTRKIGAKWTNKDIAADEKIEMFQLDYEGKHDRWNGYDTDWHAHNVVEISEAREEARSNYRKEARLKNLDVEDESEDGDDLRVDEAYKVEFGKVEKRVRSSGGGSTGTVRNLRIREDTAKYLLNLDVNSAYYDPKTRSMREDPLPDADLNEKFYLGDNQYRNSGQADEFKQMNLHAWEAFEKGQGIHMQAAPSQAEFLYKNFQGIKEKVISKTKDAILEKYGNAATEEDIPRELLFGQSERQVEYDRAGRVIKGQEAVVARSKYEEGFHINNHTTAWGSWWKNHQWGYKCCKQMIRNSYCTGAAGIEAAEAAADIKRIC